MEKFELLETQSETLKIIATKYPKKSLERSALERAALALCFVTMEHSEAFDKFVRDARRELNPGQREKLRDMGID